MNETIYFPEALIPQIVKIIKRGLVGEKNKEIKRNLLKQCAVLTRYWKDLQGDEKE